MAVLQRLVRRLEGTAVLDAVADPVAGVVSKLVGPRLVRNVLSGTNLGHPLHPALTDLPIGAWGMATLLDRGGPRCEPGADLLVGAGVVAALPTAVAGLNDWSDTIGPERRVGVVHAMANVTALGLYVGSLLARQAGRRRAGKALAGAGLSVLVIGAYLGGHLSFARAVNVNRTAFEDRPRDWTPVLSEAQLGEGQHRRVSADGAPVLVARVAGQVWALANTCSHAGGPLDEGTVRDGCVVCPWHGSTFRLTDGEIVRGPASTPQPSYETRVRDGKIELRALA
jgi:nitrite reductase/ring-hydroxylating ferredoxin subunit